MAIDDQKFFAWLDGELDPAEAARVGAEVAADPRLARMAEQHRLFETKVRTAFDAVARAPVPERLTSAVQPPRAQVVDFGARLRARASRMQWAPVPQWAAMAATLVVGVLVGTSLNTGSASEPVEVRGGKLYAAGSVDQALDRQLASADSSQVRIGLTFRDQSGSVCRSFTGAGASGLACREGGDWQLRGLFAEPEGQHGEYRMAAGVDPNLAALIDSTIAGEAFDAEQEKAARERGWR